jgi:hypothetical protein
MVPGDTSRSRLGTPERNGHSQHVYVSLALFVIASLTFCFLA